MSGAGEILTGGDAASEMIISNSDIEGGIRGSKVIEKSGGTLASIIDGGGNINANPVFRNAAAGELRILSSSPCIDAGKSISTLFTDLRGSLRPIDGNNDGTSKFDIGAYEYSRYYGQVEDDTVKAFRDLRVAGAFATFLATDYEYEILNENLFLTPTKP